MTPNALAAYRSRFPDLVRVAARLEQLLREYLAGVPRIDQVGARAKDPLRFTEKARRTIDGEPKYASPLEQIQDQMGARVVVYYTSDVTAVAEVVERYFHHIERQDVVPDSEREFGYFGRHWIFALPLDAVPADVDDGSIPRFFELQVKTLFQHAWSEASHDLDYKGPDTITMMQERKFAFTAAQAWGADLLFGELHRDLRNDPDDSGEA